MNLFNQNNMIFWEKVDAAAQYVVHLSIQAKLITRGYCGGRYHESSNFLKEKHRTNFDGDVASQVIDIITVPREKTYYTFSDLVCIKVSHTPTNGATVTGLDYYATVIAEDREGKEIDKASVLVDIRRQ